MIFYYLFVQNVSYLLANFHLFKIVVCLVLGFIRKFSFINSPTKKRKETRKISPTCAAFENIINLTFSCFFIFNLQLFNGPRKVFIFVWFFFCHGIHLEEISYLNRFKQCRKYFREYAIHIYLYRYMFIFILCQPHFT